MAQSDKGVTLSRLPETPTADGFNWRKYGQKVISNKFIRSYYKCTNVSCPARKQVQRSHDGHVTEINYLLEHKHPKLRHTIKVALSENLVPDAVIHSTEIGIEVNSIPPDSKRRKKETNYTPHEVVETTSAADVVNDGYGWIKYGQKLTKSNPYPRSYYRCFEAGCPVKKHVERASHDEKVVVTTYKGSHDHDMPGGIRTVTQNDLNFAMVPEISNGDSGNFGNHSNGWLNDDDDDDTVSNDKSGIELVTISRLGPKTRSSPFLDGSPTLKSTNHIFTHEPAAPENSDEPVGLWRGNAVGLAAKKLLQAAENRYPNTFTGVKIRFKSIWLSTLKEFHEVIEDFLKASVDKLSKDQITSLREDLVEFEKFGFDLSWAHKRVDMVEMLRFGNDPLRQELKSSEESLELFKGRLFEKQKQFAEAREMLEKAQLMYDNAKDARNNKARELAEKFGGEYDSVLNGQLGFGMLPGYY